MQERKYIYGLKLFSNFKFVFVQAFSIQILVENKAVHRLQQNQYQMSDSKDQTTRTKQARERIQ